jgi:hypothetical protein
MGGCRQHAGEMPARNENIIRLTIVSGRKGLGNAGMGACLFTLPVMLQIIDLLEKIIAGGLQAHSCLVTDTEQFQGVFKNATLHVFVLDTPDLDLAVYPFELGGTIVIRKRGKRDFHGNKLGFVVSVRIETRFQTTVGAILQKSAHQLVTVPVEEQDSHKQYGSNMLHVHKLITFLNKKVFFFRIGGRARG